MNLLDNFLKGLIFKSEIAYRCATLIKFRGKYDLRFKLAAKYINPGESILELCPAFGEFINYLPDQCSYTCIERSPQFTEILRKKNIECINLDLREGLSPNITPVDVVVIVVSLCQFRSTSINDLLQDLKTIAKKIIIIESIEKKSSSKNLLIRRLGRYLANVEYYQPVNSFYYSEFEQLLKKHNYLCQQYNDIYAIASYGTSIIP